jgi:predicted metalloprotease with PDZ domain
MGVRLARLTPSTTAAVAGPAFALVNTVADASPAQRAGLEAGDRLVQLGPLDAGNHRGLAALAEVTAAHENVGDLAMGRWGVCVSR